MSSNPQFRWRSPEDESFEKQSKIHPPQSKAGVWELIRSLLFVGLFAALVGLVLVIFINSGDDQSSGNNPSSSRTDSVCDGWNSFVDIINPIIDRSEARSEELSYSPYPNWYTAIREVDSDIATVYAITPDGHYESLHTAVKDVLAAERTYYAAEYAGGVNAYASKNALDRAIDNFNAEVDRWNYRWHAQSSTNQDQNNPGTREGPVRAEQWFEVKLQ